MKRKRWLAGVSIMALLAAGGAWIYAAPLAADPQGWKDCSSALPALPGLRALRPSAGAASLPARRMGEPADIADACLYLCSGLAAYVSGAALAVHGGGERPSFLDLAQADGQP